MKGDVHPRIKTLEIWWEMAQIPVGLYVVEGDAYAMIDTGPPQASSEVMASVLRTFDLVPQDIDCVANTHGHLDHIGGNAFLKEAGGTSLMIHKEDEFFLRNHSRSFDLFYASLIKGDIQEEKEAFVREAGPELAVDRLLNDNDLIDLGGGVQLRVVHLPGHTPGSAGFYWEREAILLCGDSVPGLNTVGGCLPLIWDLQAYEKSIRRLMEIPLRLMFFSHAYRGLRQAPSLMRKGSEIGEYLSDSLDAARRLNEAVQRAAHDERSLVDIADRVVAELPVEMGFRRMAELALPQMSLNTVFWGISQVKNPLRLVDQATDSSK